MLANKVRYTLDSQNIGPIHEAVVKGRETRASKARMVLVLFLIVLELCPLF